MAEFLSPDTQITALVPIMTIVAVGSGLAGLGDIKTFREIRKDPAKLSATFGIDAESVRRVAEAPDDRKDAILREAMARVSPETNRKIGEEAQKAAERAQAMQAAPGLPTLNVWNLPDGTRYFSVEGKPGKEIYLTQDQGTALMAHGEALRHAEREKASAEAAPPAAEGQAEVNPAKGQLATDEKAPASSSREPQPAAADDQGPVETPPSDAKPVGEPEARTENPYRDAEGKLKVAEGESDASRNPALASYEAKMKSIADDPAASDAIYNQLEGTFGGKVIGTDLYRNLLPEYAAGREGRIQHVEATGRVASAAAKDRLWRELVNPQGRTNLLFTAGGVAAGKSSVLTDAKVADADLVFDGTLRNTRWAIDTIRLARQHGWEVHIDYVQRPMDLVIQGAIDRAQEDGRWGSLATLPSIHQAAQRSIREITDALAEDSGVGVYYWNNIGTLEKPEKAQRLSREEIDSGGAHFYDEHDELGPRKAQPNHGRSFSKHWQSEVQTAFQRAVESGKYDPEILANLAKDDPGLEGLLAKGEGAQKPETDRSPEIAAPKLKPAPVVPVENGHVSPTDLTPESYDFIESSLGHAGWGEISPEIVSQAKEQLLPGEIRIQEGVHFSDGTGFGWIHAHDHEKGIRKAGWASVKDFLADTLSGFDEIWRQPNGRFLLVKRGGSMAGTPVQPSGKLPSVPVAVVELQPSAGFYGLTTAFLERAKRDLSKKNTLVWERSVPAIANLGKSNAP